jgi:hypothetical protein
MTVLDVYVIHSPGLAERRAVLEPALVAAGWTAHWITEPDSAAFTPATRLRYRAHPRLTRSELSVYLKHVEALRRIAAGDREVALVLEDDALLPDDAAAVLSRYQAQLPAGFDAAFLGVSCDLHAAPLPATPLFGAGPRTRSMSGVLITRDCARRLSAWLEGRAIAQPIDITIDEIIRGESLRCYWSVPPVIGNGSESGQYRRAVTNAAWREYPWVRRLRRWGDRIPRLFGGDTRAR